MTSLFCIGTGSQVSVVRKYFQMPLTFAPLTAGLCGTVLYIFGLFLPPHRVGPGLDTLREAEFTFSPGRRETNRYLTEFTSPPNTQATRADLKTSEKLESSFIYSATSGFCHSAGAGSPELRRFRLNRWSRIGCIPTETDIRLWHDKALMAVLII